MFYKHKKTGKFYALIAFATDATNFCEGTPFAVYREVGQTSVFVRERAEFDAKFERVTDEPTETMEGANASTHQPEQ